MINQIKPVQLTLFFVCLFCFYAQGQVSIIPKPLYNNPWQADTVYLGADIVIKSSMQDVVVSLNLTGWASAAGIMSAIIQNNPDSTIFLFHTNHKQFQDEQIAINLGTFETGTSIVFRFEFTDTLFYRSLNGKKIYTGQNLESRGDYVSEIISIDNNRKLTAVGQINSNLIEVGFSDGINNGFRNAVLEVQNGAIQK